MDVNYSINSVYRSTKFGSNLLENLEDNFITKFVRQTTVLPNQAYFIVRIPDNVIVYASPQFEKLTGYTSKEIDFNLIHSTIHPDDKEMYFRNVKYMFEYISKGKAFLENGIIRTNYRMQNKNGEYISLLKEITLIKFDKNDLTGTLGKILLTDISSFKHDSKISIEIITDKTYELKLTSDDISCKIHNLTKRENEIVVFLKQGKTSIEIAKVLFISKNTVDTHRRHIVKKLGISSTNELLHL